MSEPAAGRPRETVRETVALVLLAAWVMGPFLAVIGGLASTRFDGEPVPRGDYVFWRTVAFSGVGLTVLGPVVAWWLTRSTAFRVAAGLETILTFCLVVAAFS